MKRMIAPFMVVCLVILSGCGKASGMSETYYKCAEKIVEVAEQYLDMEITADEAKEQIAELKDRLNGIEPVDSEADLDESEKSSVKIDALSIELEVLHIEKGLIDGMDDDIKAAKDAIKAKL